MMDTREATIQEEIQKHKNIPLILDSYTDIFSDFDPRPVTERALSDDFLAECKRAARDKDEMGLELVLSVPNNKRNLNQEVKIRRRLKEHFRKHHQEKEKEISKLKREGVIWVVLGIVILLSVVYCSVKFSSPFIEGFVSIFEIPSWFLVWEGMSKIVIDSRKLETEHIFYQKMASVSIIFKGY